MSIELTPIALRPVRLLPIELVSIGGVARGELINALFGSGEAGALYERSTVSDFSATHPDLSGNGDDATLAGDTYSVTLPDLGTDATVAYATPESIVIVDGQTVSGATTLADRWLKYVILDRALTAEERSTLVEWMGADGATEPDFFVDSVSGNDANAGTEADAAFATLGAAQTAALAHGNGVHVALAAGSEWRESLDLSTLTGAKVTGIGTLIDSGLPVVRGDDVITGDWDDSTDRADAHTNVYSQSLAWTSVLDSGGLWLGLWEDGTRLLWAASLADCNATPGTFFSDPAANGTISTSPVTIYIHPYGSTNPGSDGKTYEGTTRAECVWLGNDSAAKLIYGRRNGGSLGSIVGTDRTSILGCLAEEGIRHVINIRSGSVKYSVGWNQTGETRAGYILIEFYTPSTVTDANGDVLIDHCIGVVDDDTILVAGHGIGGHTNGAQYYRNITIRDSSTRNCGMRGCEVQNLSFVRPYVQNGPLVPLAHVAPSPSATVTDYWLDYPSGAPQVRFSGLHVYNISSGSVVIDGFRCFFGAGAYPENENALVFLEDDLSASFELKNSVIFDDGTNVTTRIFISAGENVTFSLNGVVLDAGDGFTPPGNNPRGISYAGTATLVAENNAYLDSPPGGTRGLKFTKTGVASPNNVADWLTWAQGQGLESGSLDHDCGVVDPDNGDFSLSNPPANGAGLDRVNVTYTPIPASLAAAETWIIKNAE